jgi:hypothetical protein
LNVLSQKENFAFHNAKELFFPDFQRPRMIKSITTFLASLLATAAMAQAAAPAQAPAPAPMAAPAVTANPAVTPAPAPAATPTAETPAKN